MFMFPDSFPENVFSIINNTTSYDFRYYVFSHVHKAVWVEGIFKCIFYISPPLLPPLSSSLFFLLSFSFSLLLFLCISCSLQSSPEPPKQQVEMRITLPDRTSVTVSVRRNNTTDDVYNVRNILKIRIEWCIDCAMSLLIYVEVFW